MLKKMFSLTGMVLLCTILAKQAMSGEGIRPRGVRPDLGALYAAGRDFQVMILVLYESCISFSLAILSYITTTVL